MTGSQNGPQRDDRAAGSWALWACAGLGGFAALVAVCGVLAFLYVIACAFAGS